MRKAGDEHGHFGISPIQEMAVVLADHFSEGFGTSLPLRSAGWFWMMMLLA